jgi:hypothetical protein
MIFFIYEHKEDTNFRRNHRKDKDLFRRILLKCNEIKEDSYNSKFKQLKSSKCSNVNVHELKNRIFFLYQKKDIEIVFIITRRDNFKNINNILTKKITLGLIKIYPIESINLSKSESNETMVLTEFSCIVYNMVQS